jgi:predicted nucleotidyltransferase
MISNISIFQSPELVNLCKLHKVKELYAFGSVARGTATDKSDIDLLVEIDEPNPIKKGKLLLSLYEKFERLFNRKVDLVTADSITNPIFEEHVGMSKQLIYDGSKS